MGNIFQDLTGSKEYGNLAKMKNISSDGLEFKLKFEQDLLKSMASFAMKESFNTMSLDILQEKLNKSEDKVYLLNLLKQIAKNSYEKEDTLYSKISNININRVNCDGYSYMKPGEQKDLYLLNFFSDNGNITQKIAEEISSKTYIDTFTKAERITGKEYQIYNGENGQPYIEGISSTKNIKKKPTSTVFKAMSLSGRGGKFVKNLKGKEFAEIFSNAAVEIVNNLYSEYNIESGWKEKIRKFMIKEVVLYASKPVLPKSGTADTSRTRKVVYGLGDFNDAKLIELMNNFLIEKVEEIAKTNDISSKIETKQNDDNTNYFSTIFNEKELTLFAESNNDLQESINIHLSLTDGSNIKISHTKMTKKDTSIYRLQHNAGTVLTKQQLQDFAKDVVKVINDNLIGVQINHDILKQNIVEQIVSLYEQYDNSKKTSTFFQFLFGTAGTRNVKSKAQGTLGEVINAAIIKTVIKDADVQILGQTSNDLTQQAHIDIQVKIGDTTIGIQSKQYNANKLSDTVNFYGDDYNIFHNSIQRYFSTASVAEDGTTGYKIDEELIKLLRFYAYNLILNNKPNGELSDQINEELGRYFEQFARIADYTNLDLSNIKTNFFAYNFTLIPMSYIIHSIIEYINSDSHNSSSSLFTIQAPEFSFKKKDDSDNNSVKENDTEENSAGESIEGNQIINLSSISYQPTTQGYHYQITGTRGIKNLVSYIHFKGLKVSIKNYFVTNEEVN